MAPQDPNARAVRAEANYKLHRYKEAEEDARRALALDPKNRRAAALLPLVQGRWSGSAPAAAPQGAQGSTAAGSAQGSGAAARPAGPTSAQLEAQQTATRLKARQHLTQAVRALSMREHEQALASVEKALLADPKLADAYGLRSMARRGRGGPENARAAVEDAETAVGLEPKVVAHRGALIAALIAGGYPKERVLAELQAAAELDPNFAAAFEAELRKSRDGGEQAERGARQAGPGAQDAGGAAWRALFGRLSPRAQKGLAWGLPLFGVLLGCGIWAWLRRDPA